MPVVANLFEEETKNKVIPNLFEDAPKSSVVPNLFGETKPKNWVAEGLKKTGKEILQEGIVKPVKTFYGGTLKSAANFADTLDFYSDKIAKTLNIPETKNSIFEILRDDWNYYGDKLQKEGISEGVVKKIYSGLGNAGFEVPKLMALGQYGLIISGAAEGGKTGGGKGAAVGAITGGLTKGMLKGLNVLPAPVKLPTAFGVGAVTTPGDLEEKVAGGAVFTGLSLGGKSPTIKEFKETQLKYSPLVKGYQKVLPFETRERVYQNYINRMQSIENIVDKAQNLGAKILPGENPALRARTYLGIGEKVKTVLENKTYKINPDGTFTYTGEGLKPILDDYDKRSPIKGRDIRDKDLNDYLIARRTVEDLQRPKSEFTEENIATPEQIGKARLTLKNLNQKYGKNISHLDQTATRLYDYQKRILFNLVDSGNISQEQYNIILEKNPNYVPFDRVIESVDTAGTPISKNRFTGARSPIKRIKGSELEIHNPIESMIKNTYRIMDIAERNTVARSVAKLSEILPEDISPVKIRMQPITIGKYTEGEPNVIFRPSQFKPKGNVIEYFDNGKRKYIEVTPNLYQAMTGLNETSTSMLIKIMSIPAGTLRVGATITPEFMLRNPIRDQWTALMQTKLGFKPFVDTTGAIADIMKKSEAYNDWLRSGGAYAGFVELSRPKLQKQLNALKGNSSLLSKLNIITKAQDISQLFEQATRLATYKAGIKQGLTPVEAGFESREATLDFARRGAKTKGANAVIAFFNAGIQGTDKLVRTAQEDPVGFATKGIASITIPSIITYALNRNDPEYKELPRWQKDLFWMFKVNNTWVRIPKPFSYGQIFGSLPERFFEYLDTQDPQAFNNLSKSLYESLTPASGDPAGSLMATGVKPIIENEANWNFFLQRHIIPEYKEKALPKEQYNRYTTETAKFIGEKTENLPDIPIIKYLKSPAKLENIVQGWFGGTGRYILEAPDLTKRIIAKITGQPSDKRPLELADIPLIKGFVTRPALSQSESVAQFYQNRDNITQIHTSIKQYYQSGNKQSAEKLKLKFPEFKTYQGINKTSKALSDLNKYSDYIIKSNKTEAEKRELLKIIDKRKVEIAQKANSIIDEFKKTKARRGIVPNLFKEENKSRIIPNLFD